MQAPDKLDKINADNSYSDRVEYELSDSDFASEEQLHENFDNSEDNNSSSIIDGLITKLKDFKSRMISDGKNSEIIVEIPKFGHPMLV